MNNFQFMFACFSSIAALMGASWIVAQSLSRARTETQNFQKEIVEALSNNIKLITESKKNPDYDKRLTALEEKFDTVQSTIASAQSTIAVLQHGHNNMKTGFDGFNQKLDNITNKIMTILENRGK